MHRFYEYEFAHAIGLRDRRARVHAQQEFLFGAAFRQGEEKLLLRRPAAHAANARYDSARTFLREEARENLDDLLGQRSAIGRKPPVRTATVDDMPVNGFHVVQHDGALNKGRWHGYAPDNRWASSIPSSRRLP